MAKLQKKYQAQELRKLGKSIREISKTLNVSQGSVSFWCKEILLTPEQKYKIEKRRVDPNNINRKRYLEYKKKSFNEYLIKIHKNSIKKIGKLNEREIFLIGVALYWGEGFKKDNQVGFANMDLDMIKFFIFWLKKCFKIETNQLIIRITLNISYKEEINRIQNYWSNLLNIPLSQFSKPFFQNTIQKRKYKNTNAYNGVLRIKVRKSVNLLRKINGFIDGINLASTSQTNQPIVSS